jgi:hypothetical protein
MKNQYRVCLIAVVLSAITALSQEAVQSLMVSGGSGSVPVAQINGKNYVSLEALAQATKGSLSFNGNQVTLTLPNGEGGTTQSPAAADTGSGFSAGFLRTGIEAMSALREWHSALASAIENNYPVTNEGLSSYQRNASTDLHLAQAAATTDADQNLSQLVASAYQKMKELSDKYVAERKDLNYVDPNALANDSSNQNLVACGKSLAAILASRQFADDGTCH